MAEFEFDIRDLYRVFRRRRWVLLLSPVLVGLLTFAMTEKEPPVYQAEALVKISRVAANMQALLIEALTWYQGDNISTQSQIITSQKVRSRVALRLSEKYGDYRPLAELARQIDADDYDLLEQRVRADAALVDLVSLIAIEAERREDSDIVAIVSTADSGELAIDTVNFAAEEYVDFNVAEKNAQIREAVKFIQSKIGETEKELADAELELEAFRRRHSEVLGAQAAQTGDLAVRMESLERRRSGIEEVISRLSSTEGGEKYLGLSPVLTNLEDPVVSSLQQQLSEIHSEMSELEGQRRDLLSYRQESSREVQEKVREAQELRERAGRVIEGLADRYRTLLADLERQQRNLQQQSVRLQQVPEISRQAEYLERQVELRTEALNLLQSRLQDAQIQSAGEIKEVTIVERASSATVLPQASRMIKILVAILIGTILGGVFAIVLESMDTSIGTIDDVERYLETRVLGVIPHVDHDLVRQKISLEHLGDAAPPELARMTNLCAHFIPNEPVSEAFRSLRAQLDVLLKKDDLKTLLLTSSVLQEGKTSTACNLAVVFAQTGRRTILIDADLRRPQIHKTFGLSESPGLSDVLLGVTEWEQSVRSINDLLLGKFGLKNSHLTPGLEYLFLLTAGRKVENPAEILNLESFKQMLSEIREQYDIMIVDSAPVLPVADASQLAPGLDAVLLAYQIGRAGREVASRSKNRLESVGGNVIGVVMNDIEAEIYQTRDYDYYGYKYKYEEAAPAPPARAWSRRLKAGLSGLLRRRPSPSVPEQQPPPKSPASGRQGAPPDDELRDIMNLTDEENRL